MLSERRTIYTGSWKKSLIQFVLFVCSCFCFALLFASFHFVSFCLFVLFFYICCCFFSGNNNYNHGKKDLAIFWTIFVKSQNREEICAEFICLFVSPISFVKPAKPKNRDSLLHRQLSLYIYGRTG